MGSVIPFDFKGNSVRVVSIDGEPWFVGNDVAEALGYAKPRNAVASHCKRAKSWGALNQGPLGQQNVGGHETLPPSGLDPQIKIIPESDVYRLIVRSNKPEAEAFEAMIMEEILPTIRKTGGYGKTDVAALTRSDLAQMVLDAEREREVLAIKSAEQECKIVNMTPKAEAHDRFLSTDGMVNLRTAMRELGARPNLAIAHLRKEGVLFKEGLNNATPKANLLARGYFAVRPSTPDRNGKVYPQTFVTPRGLDWLDSRIPETLRAGGAA